MYICSTNQYNNNICTSAVILFSIILYIDCKLKKRCNHIKICCAIAMKLAFVLLYSIVLKLPIKSVFDSLYRTAAV